MPLSQGGALRSRAASSGSQRSRLQQRAMQGTASRSCCVMAVRISLYVLCRCASMWLVCCTLRMQCKVL